MGTTDLGGPREVRQARRSGLPSTAPGHSVLDRGKDGPPKHVVLLRVAWLGIRRHAKIRSAAVVHDLLHVAYFEQRRQRQRDAREHDYYGWLEYQRLEVRA